MSSYEKDNGRNQVQSELKVTVRYGYRPEDTIRTDNTENGDAPRSGSLRANEREALKRKIEQRPCKQKLVTQHILLSASCADSLIQKKAEVLKRCKLKDSLNKKLQHRPGPLELVTKKILQADAELEQAIQEGRILFTKTTDAAERNISNQHSLHAEMEVISTASTYDQNNPKSSSSCTAKSKVRKKSHLCRTPYQQTALSNCAKSNLKTATSPNLAKVVGWRKEGTSAQDTQPLASDTMSGCNAVVSASDSEATQVQSSYDLLLQQQQLFLQWQKEVEEARANNASRCANTEVHFSAVHEEHMRKSPSESCSVTETSPSAVQTMGNTHSSGGEYAFDVDSRTLICEQPMLEQCCQNSTPAPTTTTSEASPPTTAVARPASSTAEKPKLKLSDYRVQDLKNECKKRQLPVSGAKPQLVERLKPFEEAILAASADEGAAGAREVVSATSPTSEWSNGSNRLPPISNVINDYIQHNFTQPPQQVAHLQPLLLHVPAVSQQQQLLHLVDSNGSLVAMATVPGNVQCCRVSSDCACDGSQQPVGAAVGQYDNVERTELVSQPTTSLHNEPTFSFAQLGSGGQFTLVQATSSGDSNKPSESTVADDTRQQCTPGVVTCSQLQQPCGGQLAHAPCCSLQPTSPNVQSCGAAVLTPMQQQQSIQFGNNANTSAQLLSANPTQIVPAQTIQMLAQPMQLSSAQLLPAGAAPNSSHPCFVGQGDSIQYATHYVVSVSEQTQQPSRQEGVIPTQCARCSPAQAAAPPLGCSPVMGDSAPGSSPNVPSPPAKLDGSSRSQGVHSIHVDPNDTNALLSATTLSIHEEMLRFQQRKIEELQKELHRSQQQLKHQQQVILAAKRAQQTKRQECAQQKGECQQSQADVWLNQLDIKHLNKFHIQLFLQHKLQQQQMQEQILEQQKLTTTEQKLQEELHVEQAVQDIVRLIKQDARTALLIVQLLRRYQLERGRQAAANAAVVVSNGECVNASSGVSSEQQQQVVACNAEGSGASGGDQVGQDVAAKRTSTNDDEEPTPSVAISAHSKPKSKKKSVVSRSASSKADPGDCKEKASTAQVDMEEIFRKVLEDASRALLLNDSDKRDESSAAVASEEILNAHSQPSGRPQEQQQTLSFNNGASQAPELCTNPSEHDHFTDSFAPTQSSPAFFVGDQEVHAECADDRYEERVEVLEEGAAVVDEVEDQPVHYSKNQAFDDLMDVLRDDQATTTDERRLETDFGANAEYESNELATLLDDTWFDSETVAQPTPAYDASCAPYAQDEANELIDDMDSRDGAEQGDSAMSCFEPNQLTDQAMNMDWLDLMLPSPGHDNMSVQPLYNQMVADTEILG
ncbi:MKL/myocardin-like protein 1 [Toxocara canis]|uniref:MKL/myocardin-like protein 1 n=1 Tax=Toxocara canis TaxID=6265 RepID=A0A0B2VSP7_TOXCA|nr:MKL/myocardin-like protein 1 [Toxocara canis]